MKERLGLRKVLRNNIAKQVKQELLKSHSASVGKTKQKARGKGVEPLHMQQAALGATLAATAAEVERGVIENLSEDPLEEDYDEEDTR